MPMDCKTEYSFPFEPYKIQEDFMKALHEAYENKKLGIFESPTGTGKSLSLICGTLSWLHHHLSEEKISLENYIAEKQVDNISSSDDWFSAYAKKAEMSEEIKDAQNKLNSINKQESKIKIIKKGVKVKSKETQEKLLQDDFVELFGETNDVIKEIKAMQNQLDDCEILLDDYQSDDDENKDDVALEDANSDYNLTKVYFCSRTHSQLTQFVRELQKTKFAENTRVTCLGSRQNMCINSKVNQLKSINLMNEKCLEMQRNKSKEEPLGSDGMKTKRKKLSQNCSFHSAGVMERVRNSVLLKVQDIEQIVETGKKMRGCPFYAARHAIEDAHVVVMPYNLLLHKASRKSSKIDLRNSIVIIDEAHNLLDTINNIHSCEINGAQLCKSFSQLSSYLERFVRRMKPRNVMFLKQLLYVISNFIKLFGGIPGDPPSRKLANKASNTSITTINDFLLASNIDNLNLYKIFDFCNKAQLSRKLQGFVEKYNCEVHSQPKEEKDSASSVRAYLHNLQTQKNSSTSSESAEINEQTEKKLVSASPLFQIESFLLALTSANQDGRISKVSSNTLGHCSLKFLSLNPALYFADIIAESRSIILAGGTMEPIDEFSDQLFCGVRNETDRILHFSCGHVIPPDNIMPLTMSSGPTGKQFEFTYNNKNSENLISELGQTLFNICNVTPGGIVCFFASYEYEETVFKCLEKSGALNRIRVKKSIFREPKTTGQVDKILSEYSKCIEQSKKTPNGMSGAIIFSVVGGKLSEGINFSDDLGRCVIMVGLPYPNSKSAELNEKMNYLDKTLPKKSDGRSPGQIHYENLCMKAVNQSIGRAIRHRNDHAAIVLIDSRYSKESVKKMLPQWISKQLRVTQKFGQAYSLLCKFFSEKKKRINI